MTAQIAEKLHYEGKQLRMCAEPLGDYFAFTNERPDFDWNCTALWRGYVGTWEIVEGRLYLIDLHGSLNDGSHVSVETIFPGFPDRVFAHWYSGEIRVPMGKCMEYVHMGYGSRYERDLFLTFEKGVFTATREHVNGQSNRTSGPEGYGVGAITTFPRNGQNDREAK